MNINDHKCMWICTSGPTLAVRLALALVSAQALKGVREAGAH